MSHRRSFVPETQLVKPTAEDSDRPPTLAELGSLVVENARKIFAREGPARMLDVCRHYLLMIAIDEIGPVLRAELSTFDLLHDTFSEAQRHLNIFTGKTRCGMRVWSGKLLEARLATIRRSYRATEKQADPREAALDSFSAAAAREAWARGIEHLRRELAEHGPLP
jgi:hypothetical protein